MNKKLTLKKETLYSLNHDESAKIMGGGDPVVGTSNHPSCQNYGCIQKFSVACPSFDYDCTGTLNTKACY
jgi:hypothetical protein